MSKCNCKLKADNKACFSGNSGIPRGSRGPVGSRGIKGPQGDRGLVGPRGHMGFKGKQGDRGAAGPQGKKGAGEQGPRGSLGYQGYQGDIGPQGFMGETGVQGVQGATGTLIKFLELTYFGGASQDDSGRPLTADEGDYWLVLNSGGDLSIWSGGSWNVINTPNGQEFYYFDTVNGVIWRDVINGGVASVNFAEECQYKNGDKVMDCLTGDWYIYDGSQFTLECNLKGETGVTGLQGVPGAQGSVGETGVQGAVGETGVSAWHDYNRTEVTGASYVIELNDEIIGINPEGATGVLVTLPLISGIGGTNKRRYVITDEGGNASTDNITIVPTGSDTILGTASYVLTTDYQTVCFYSNQVDNWMLC